MKATVVLIATVISLSSTQARLEEPLGDLLRAGDSGVVFYQLEVNDDSKVVALGSAEVTESTVRRTLLEVGPPHTVKTGHQVRFELPIARLSPSDLARLVELGAEVAEPDSGTDTPPPNLEKPVLALVNAWRDAWQRQDTTQYLGCYSANFEPSDGSTLDAWRELRKRRLERPDFIEVELTDIQLEPADNGDVRVQFEQAFRSPDFADSVRKELIVTLESAGWQIVRERSLP